MGPPGSVGAAPAPAWPSVPGLPLPPPIPWAPHPPPRPVSPLAPRATELTGFSHTGPPRQPRGARGEGKDLGKAWSACVEVGGGLVSQGLGTPPSGGDSHSCTPQGDPGAAGLKGDRVSVGLGEARGGSELLTPLTILFPPPPSPSTQGDSAIVLGPPGPRGAKGDMVSGCSLCRRGLPGVRVGLPGG